MGPCGRTSAVSEAKQAGPHAATQYKSLLPLWRCAPVIGQQAAGSKSTAVAVDLQAAAVMHDLLKSTARAACMHLVLILK